MKRPGCIVLSLARCCALSVSLAISLILGARLNAASLPLEILSITPDGAITVTNTFTNGVCTLDEAVVIEGPWVPRQNLFTLAAQATFQLDRPDGFYRAVAFDLTPDSDGYSNFVASYSLLTTIAGAGGDPTDMVNKWQPAFEGGPATAALLSRPHIAMADAVGNIYIADKDAHAIRKVLPDGTIVTVAGTNGPGNAPDAAIPGVQAALNQPNGLWVRADGTIYILDLQNGKIRRLDTNGDLTLLFRVPGGISTGRGLWVNDDETLAYVCSGTVVKRWTPSEGVTNLATGFIELGNLAIDPQGKLVVTDRGGHCVYRIGADGSKTQIAGNGAISGGGDGEGALETGLNEVRAVWFLPNGGYFLATHRGSQVWYVDTVGIIHLFLNGLRFDTHSGDDTYFYNLSEFRVSEVRAVTVDHQGNLLITENDSGYVRKVRFLRYVP